MNKDKLHQILSSLWKNDDSVGNTYYNQALQDVQTAIDLQEEPVSEELEEAANNALNNVLNTHEIVNVRSCLEMFRFGAKWQKEQMMAKAIYAVVSQVPCANEIILRNPESVHWFYLPQEMNNLGINKGDKVKLIIIKED